ncbi:TPA: G5 domain-containing protein, partial [Streptococcus suis]
MNKVILGSSLLVATVISTDVVAASEISVESGNQVSSLTTNSSVTSQEVEVAKQNFEQAEKVLQGVNEDITSTNEMIDSTSEKVAILQNELDKAEDIVSQSGNPEQLEAELNQAKVDLDVALKEKESIEAQDPNENMINEQSNAVFEKTEALNKAKSYASKTNSELESLNSKLTDIQKNINQLNEQKTDKLNEIESLKNRSTTDYKSNVNLTLTKEYVNELSNRERIYYALRQEYLGVVDGKANLEVKQDAEKQKVIDDSKLFLQSVGDSANNEKLVSLAKAIANNPMNRYEPSEQDKTNEIVDIYNLTDEQRRDITLFGIDIVNQIRKQIVELLPENQNLVRNDQFGVKSRAEIFEEFYKVTPTEGMFKFAQYVADKKNSYLDSINSTIDSNIKNGKNYLDGILDANGKQVSAGSPVVEPSDYSVDDMFDAAKLFGLSHQLDHRDSSKKAQRQGTKSIVLEYFAKDITNVNNRWMPKGEERIKNITIDQNNKFFMSDLKQLIFDGFKNLMFVQYPINEANYGTTRSWEYALSVAGLLAEIDPLQNTDFKSPIGSLGFSLYRQPWGDKSKKNYSFQLFFYQESGAPQSQPNYTGGEYLKGFAVPGINPAVYTDEFAKTITLPNINIENDIKKLEDTIESIQKAISNANSNWVKTKSTRDSKQEELNKINSTISTLQVSLDECEEKLVNLKAQLAEKNSRIEEAKTVLDAKIKANEEAKSSYDSAVNAKVLLEEAKKNLEQAQETLSAEQTKLAQLQHEQQIAEQEYKVAKENYDKLLLLFESSKPLITSKGNQTPPTHSLPEAKIELKEVNFETVYENDLTLELDKETVVREGQNGSVQVITIGNQVTEIVVTEKVDKIVKRGTL